MTAPALVERSCGVCGATTAAEQFWAREMMFGSRERYLYFQCAACGCLQLADPPADLSAFYPSAYYAHRATPADRGPLFRLVRRARDRYALTGRGIVGGLLSAAFPYTWAGARHWLALDGVTSDSRILDVGAGTGALVRDLRGVGFRNVLGIDPVIAADVYDGGEALVLKRGIHEVEGEFDVVMLHHALEHIPDQLGTMLAVRGLLRPGGHAVIRVPIVSSFAWEHYREDWVQLDAPRHLFVHSNESMRLLGERAGLRLARVRHDSTEFQFVGSELYRRDIPLTGHPPVFSRGELREFRRRARELNDQGRGDQAVFYFTTG